MLLRDIEMASTVMVHENGVPQPYYLVERTQNDCVLLRAHTSVYIDIWGAESYPGSKPDKACIAHLEKFDAATQAAVVEKEIINYFYEGDTLILRKSFLLATQEVQGKPGIYLKLASDNASWAATNDEGGATVWFTRTKNSSAFNGAVGSTGSIITDNRGAKAYVRPAVAFRPDTPVNEQDGVYYLMPEKLYRECEATVIVGESVARPAGAVVTVGQEGLYDVRVEVSNNAGDAEPVWVEATGGREVTLENRSRQTEYWQVGVRLYGRSATTGHFEEPIVLIKGD